MRRKEVADFLQTPVSLCATSDTTAPLILWNEGSCKGKAGDSEPKP
jgi:hypothetical protein